MTTPGQDAGHLTRDGERSPRVQDEDIMGPKAATATKPVTPAAPAPVKAVPPTLTFKVEDRPIAPRGGPAMTPLHDAIMETLTTKKAVSVPIPTGKTAVQVQRICRYPLIKLGKLKGMTFRRVVSPDHVKVWIEEKRAPVERTREQLVKDAARLRKQAEKPETDAKKADSLRKRADKLDARVKAMPETKGAKK